MSDTPLIDQLRDRTLSHVWGDIAGRVALSAVPLPGLYDAEHIMVTAQTADGCVRAMLIELARCRNGRPRLVSITTIAERGGWIAERWAA